MAGVLSPFTLFPRYTCLSGAETFYTPAIDVTRFEKAIVNMWRSPLVGPSFTITIEESSDLITWTTVDGTTTDYALAASTEHQVTGNLAKQWMRAHIILGTGTVATCWVTGFFETRTS